MTLSKIVNSIGLGFDIIGALLIWKFGLPNIPKESSIVTYGGEPSELDTRYHYKSRNCISFRRHILRGRYCVTTVQKENGKNGI